MPSSTPEVLVTVWLVTARARPKSATLTVPLSSMMTFSGLTSRWIRPPRVRLAEREQDRLEDVERGARVSGPSLAHHLAQRQARDVLHGEEHDAAVLALVVDGDDVGVRQPGGGPGLTAEPGDEALVVDEVLRA